MSTKPTAIIIGAGDATGGAIARRFAREGLTVVPVRRSAAAHIPLVASIEADGGRAVARATDARDEDAMMALFAEVGRELGPQGLHVAQMVIDGAIDTEFIASNFPERYALKTIDGLLNPDHIAENDWLLHNQPRDAWTFELDLRPWMDKMA